MEIDGLLSFCNSVCRENDDDERIYVRMRGGKSQSRATNLVSRIPRGEIATGESPSLMVMAIERHYTQIKPSTDVWVEGVLEGTSRVVETLRIPRGILPSEDPPEHPQNGYNHFLSETVSVIKEMSLDARKSARDANTLFLESQANTMKLWRELMFSKASQHYLDQNIENDRITQAITTAAPLLEAAASRMLGGTPQQVLPAAESGEGVDLLIDALVRVGTECPELITPERVARLVGIVRHSPPS